MFDCLSSCVLSPIVRQSTVWILAALLVGVVSPFNTYAQAAVVDYVGVGFRLEQGIQAGNLCNEPTQIDHKTNHLRVRWSGARLVLGHDRVGGFARGRCLVRIPALVPEGYYIASLTSRAQGSLDKPTGVSLSVSLETTLSALEPLVVARALDGAASIKSRLSLYQNFDGLEPLATHWKKALCSLGRAEEMVFGINLGVTLQQPPQATPVGSGSSVADFSGPGFGADVWIELLPCDD